MSFRSILTALRSAPTPTPGRAHARPRRAALAVAVLEDRTVPSTFTVLNLGDGKR